MKKAFRSVLAVACFLGALSAPWAMAIPNPSQAGVAAGDATLIQEAASWQDLKVELMNGALLTEDEVSNKTLVSFGLTLAEDGTVSRVNETTNAAAVVEGKYHSNEHGWNNFKVTTTIPTGAYKISMGSCAWGGDVTVKFGGETVATFNSNNGACYHGNKTDNVISAYYVAESAGELVMSGGNYTPYFAIEAIDAADIPNNMALTYSLGETGAEGMLPVDTEIELGKTFTTPVNRTLYVEGKTLTGWTDGTNTYTLGQEVTAEGKEMTLTPVFTDNKVALADRTETVSITWDFQQKNGAPVVGWQGKTALWVAQAVVNGETIDVKMPIDATNGKVANGSWSDWAQLNGGTILTIPACKGAVISLESYNATTTTTINGDVINQETKTPTYTVTSDAETAEIVIGDGSYWRTVKVDLPVVVKEEPVVPTWRDIKIDFTNDKIMTSADADVTTIGIAIAEDGTATRVAADDASANILITGKYHSTQHGLANFSATVKVEGTVKIGMGSCAWGGDVTIKNEAGETVGTFNTNNGACWNTANGEAENVIFGYYDGEATTLTISGGSYTPYFSVQAIDASEIPNNMALTYSLGETGAEGMLPADTEIELGKTFTTPVNRTLYVEGKTLTGWTDGTNTYTLGQELTAEGKEMTLTPVFTDNKVALADRTETVSITWDFQQKNGAPVVGWQGKTAFWVAQAVVNGETIDVKMPIDATNGKVANGSWTDWAQINGGTVLTIPACKGAVISLESYSATTTTTIAGDVINQETKTPTYTYEGDAETIDIVIGDGSYWRTVKVELPVAEQGGDTPTPATWRDIKIDLAESAFLEASEMDESNHPRVSLGLVVAEDGTLTRVAADDATANIVLAGCWWNSHGWSGTTATVKVEGPVKIGVGGCTYAGHTISVKNEAGEEVASWAAGGAGCWEGSKSEDLIHYGYYTGEATTLTISIPSYCPYLSIEKVEVAPTEYTVTYALGDVTCEGTVVPAAVKLVEGDKTVIPANFTLYTEGKTLTGWTDGTNTYAIGAEVTPAADMTLTPVFTDNEVSLADRTESVTLKWDFQQKNGAPIVAWQGQTGLIWVAQGVVNGKTIDVKCDISTSPGKIANANWQDWAQMNEGTTFTLPSCKGAIVGVEAYNALGTGDKPLTIDGQTDYVSEKTISYTIANTAETIDVVIGSEGSYYRYVQVTLPVVAQGGGGKTFNNEAANIVWNLTDVDLYATPNTMTPDGAFTLTTVSVGDFTVAVEAPNAGVNNGIKMLKLQPTGGDNTNVEFIIKPNKGLTFTATKVSGKVARFGTDAGTLDISIKNEEGETASLATGLIPARNNKDQSGDKHGTSEKYTTEFSFDIPEGFATTEGFTMIVTESGLATNKQWGIGDVHIEGTINGTAENVAKYTITAKANPENAGSINIYPQGSEFDEGTEIKLTATEKFGFNFVNWTDAAGNVLSEDPVYMHTLTANADLSANFVQVNTYELAITMEGGANDYMVQLSPAPTIVDGKNMYEDGTEVSLAAASNAILTFNSWSDGQTSSEIKVSMTEDIALTANYSAIDYIVGWDFYKRGNNGRVADFYSTADNEAAQLILTNESGSITGWLDKSTEAAGGYESMKGAAVNWKNLSEKYYYQTKINASEFTDIKVQAQMLYNYNAYQVQKIEYSVDGTTWTEAGRATMPAAKTVTDIAATLGEDANNAATLYIRFIPDYTSKVDGTESENDGTSITNIFVTGTMKLVDDGKAPALVSTVPATGATGASANGRVVMNFDEKIKLTEAAKATLNGEELALSAAGKTVTAEYKGLTYTTEYTFQLAAGSVSDLTDNVLNDAVNITFTTMTKPTVNKALYDFIVPDNGNFKEALQAAAARSDKSKRFRIFVKQGAHIIPANENSMVTGTDGKSYPDPKTSFNTPNTSIIGEDMELTSVANSMPNDLAANPDAGAGGQANPLEGIRTSGLLYMTSGATNTYFQDITLKTNTPDATGRNVILVDGGNKTICKDVCLWAYQDTYVSDREQSLYYFEGGVIRGRTDFICGSGDVFFNAVDIVMCEEGGYIVAPRANVKYGYVFSDCTIKGEQDNVNGNYFLGRPWTEAAETYYINCVMEAIPTAAGWTNMSAGGCTRFAEYNSVSASGTPIDLSGRVKELGNTTTNPFNPVLSAEEATEIGNMSNMFGDWDPRMATEQASAPTNVILYSANNTLVWDNDEYALLWAICKDGKVIDFTTEPTYTVDDVTATYSVRAANEMGGLGDATVATVLTGIENIQNDSVIESIYDLMGRKVQKVVKGQMYIINGQKVIIR